MGDDDWAREEIDAQFARGELSPESIIARLDDRISNTYALDPEEEVPALEAAFATASTPGPADAVLSEPAFISLLQTRATLPFGPEGIEAGRIIYASVAYLSALPFAPAAAQRPPAAASQPGLSLAQLRRGLVWALPDRAGYVVEESSDARMRTRWDHRRLLFQSLATATLPASPAAADDAAQAALARARAFDVPEESWDLCAANRDADGDEIYHDLVDVLCATQPARHPGRSAARRDAFRGAATRLRGGFPALDALAVPAPRFRALARVLLALQFAPPDGARFGAGGEVAPFEDAAQAVGAAFAQDAGRGGAAGTVITWRSFARALDVAAPHLFDPLYRLLARAFLGRGAPVDVLEAPARPARSPGGAGSGALDLPLQSQLLTFLAPCVDAASLRRVARYAASPGSVTPAGFAETLHTEVPDAAIAVFAGRIRSASPASGGGSAEASEGKPCVFGLYSPAPKADGSGIEDPADIDANNAGLRPCALFQLAPVQDVFPGVVGAEGWRVVGADEKGGGNLVFGDPGDEKGGIVLTLREGLSRGEIRHRGKGAEDGEADGGSIVYRANPYRGDWELEFVVEQLEIWTDAEA
ncbi:hypothetical protein GGS23DRAFT_617685 [Durotheca rogersii]|uniref:uncharacterized protein n=1 Tax=Durotheca rogersii TaxID=419775 RepID=UPI0022201845|nr:uncharacterized protein GGS23DRAFT_617685 [Durotheca rogersii]KAI5856791.1 hypothetical protein GGS23DRAFT_617685 [Durotheca rogersii]